MTGPPRNGRTEVGRVGELTAKRQVSGRFTGENWAKRQLGNRAATIRVDQLRRAGSTVETAHMSDHTAS